MEVLAHFRPDTALEVALSQITNNDLGGPVTAAPGVVPRSWLTPRGVATAQLKGAFCAVTDTESIAALRPDFVLVATRLGLDDFDAAALKDARPRELTQAIATYLYESSTLCGVQFRSRYGDDQVLWAIFERPDDPEVSPRLHEPTLRELTADLPEIREAFRVLNLCWAGI